MWWLLLLVVAVVCHAQPTSVYSFDGEHNSTITLGSGSAEEQAYKTARGTLIWKGIEKHSAVDFTVVEKLVTAEESQAMVAQLDGVELDQDPDSVDGEPTYEFYLEQAGSFEPLSNVRLKPDTNTATMQARHQPREALAAVARPILADRIVPLVNRQYRKQCRGRCVACQSLMRRYGRKGERNGHGVHFDIKALVTVVVSLNSYGADFDGGLFVSTGNDEMYVALQAGDAVAHQSDLLHGVKVKSGERWSWIVWFSDDATCSLSAPSTWHQEEAEAADPVAQFLQAHRIHLTPGMSPADAAAAKFSLLRAAARGKFPRAMNEVGVSYMDGIGVEVDRKASSMWLKRAAKFGEADAIYNEGLLHLDDPAVAVDYFKRAAEAGSKIAWFNLGVAYQRGAGVGAVNLDEAARYFELDGGADAAARLAALLREGTETRGPDLDAANKWLAQACTLGSVSSCFELADADASNREMDKAAGWLKKAAQHGDGNAAAQLSALLTSMQHQKSQNDEF